MSKNQEEVLKELEADYGATFGKAQGFAQAVASQISTVLDGAKIALASPIELRIKSLASILDKIERKELAIRRAEEVNDLIGLRIMLLFLRDIKNVRELIEENFTIKESEDAGERLAEDQLGYSSIHYLLEFPSSWLTVPSLALYTGMRAELQVRTMAQHIWAASSHVLQYKNEESVPKSVRRAIYRVSALLETVDLEFERVLEQRNEYRKSLESTKPRDEDLLNVDVLENVLDSEYPKLNKGPNEEYSLLLLELAELGIQTVGKLRSLIEAQKDYALAEDKRRTDNNRKALQEGKPADSSTERIEKGVFFIHTGLVRISLRKAFGKTADEVLSKKRV
jgi:putative GTP pyrophosphokinase